MTATTPHKLDLEHQTHPSTTLPHLDLHMNSKVDDEASSESIISEYKRTIDRSPLLRSLDFLAQKLSKANIESIGIRPLALSERNGTDWWSCSLIWFSCNVNVLSFSTGSLVSLLQMDMLSAMMTTLFVGGFCCIFPAYFITFGPKLGVRQMIQCRYSFGYFGASIICLLNAASMLGYCILDLIIGGQTLSAVSSRSDGSSTLTPDVGIVVAACIALVVSFSGIRILHYFERFFWLPTLICFLILIGVAGTGPDALHVASNQPKASAEAVLGFAAIIAGFIISYSALVSDVSSYLKPNTNPYKLFWSVYFGFFLSCVPFIMIGAAFACSSYDNAEWSGALQVSSGQFFELILAGKLGNFGRFLVALLALSVCGNISATIYSLGLNFQTMLPFLGPVPRFVWPLIATAIFLPLAIVGHDKFYETLTDFTSVLGYWASLYVGVVLADHVIVRKRDFASYNIKHWNQWGQLPPGLAALGACAISLAVVVPSIDQVWFSGPIAKKSGDLGFETGLVASFVLYVPLRMLEKKVFGR
ncbi:related to purine-cytosine permease [Melanopsichium pennsylvanicum]|uniref:Related to purine-cytosine permease n=2 Tax=Melanopsichium pennsylvanicum TaxID=63383 RepID=A0AAJ4XQX9_9BASI|nr:related to purine-cytosine permease [Melanopsichium pennsylvanicum 4]SNX86262.1 related to purine-cytosine permease [Melanopsichium pennsylvanicum]